MVGRNPAKRTRKLKISEGLYVIGQWNTWSGTCQLACAERGELTLPTFFPVTLRQSDKDDDGPTPMASWAVPLLTIETSFLLLRLWHSTTYCLIWEF